MKPTVWMVEGEPKSNRIFLHTPDKVPSYINKGYIVTPLCACPDVTSYHVAASIRSGWNVTKSGSKRALRHFRSRDEALSWAVMKAFTPLYVHRRDGTVSYKMSISSGGEQ